MLWWIIMILRWRNGGYHASSTNPVVPLPVVVLVLGVLIGFGVYATTLTGRRTINMPPPIASPVSRQSSPAFAPDLPEPARQFADARPEARYRGTSFSPAGTTASGFPTTPIAAAQRTRPLPPDDVPFAVPIPRLEHAYSPAPAPPLPAEADGVPVPPAPVEAAAAPPPPIPANPTPDSIADAAARLAHPDWSTRFHSVSWLSRQTPTAADRAVIVPSLVALLDDAHETTRTAAAFCLESWADASTESAITDKLAASTGETRRVLLALAVKIKTPGAAAAIAPLIVDPASRIAARRALLDMGSVAEAPVDELLKSDDAAVRHDACVILESVGTKTSIPLLKPHTRLGEKDESVKIAAGMAIEKIQHRGK
jgi:hypothetical protein